MSNENTRVAVVTGASRGLGRATALRLAKDGFAVVVHYGRNREAADEVVHSITSSGGKAFALPADVSRVDDIERFFGELDRELETRFGTNAIDVIVNNAGVNHDGGLEATSEEDFDRLFNTNVRGPFFFTQHAEKRLREGARIINIGTGLTRFSMPQYMAYSATKGAIDVLSQNLAKHLGPRGITVNTIAPGATDTDMNTQLLSNKEAVAHLKQTTALGRVGQPEDIADAVSFLASNDGRWVTGQRLEVSGGMML